MIAGYRYEITSVSLRDSMTAIKAWRYGPIPELVDEPVTVFGEDGRGWAQGGRMSMEAVPEGGKAFINLDVGMDYCRLTHQVSTRSPVSWPAVGSSRIRGVASGA
jgi:hypothetical protein